jgi:PBP1b-binding outer membrane lipoprotein LpoB
MKTIHKVKLLLGAILMAMFVVSCIPEQESIGTEGKTLVKYAPASEFSLKAIDAKSTSQSFELLSVKRDLNSADALNQTTTVELKLDSDTAMIKKYNLKHSTKFVLMPATLYSTTPATTGGKITVTFNPGEFEHAVNVTIPNASLFDFGKNYMIAYKVTVTGEGTLSGNVNDSLYRQIMAKNRFDGRYTVTGTFVDNYSSSITDNYPMTIRLVTQGKNQVRMEEPATAPWGASMIFHSIKSGGAMSVYGSFGLVIDFNDANDVVSVVNWWGQPASNSRSAALDPTGVNKWNPSTKNIQIKYVMKQPSVCPDPPYAGNVRTNFNETWTYLGPR